jgi:hypothetical protein
MEWLIGIIVFLILAKQGLRKQNKEVRVKEALGTIAANSVLEVADLLEIEVIDTSAKGKRA